MLQCSKTVGIKLFLQLSSRYYIVCSWPVFCVLIVLEVLVAVLQSI